MKKIYEKPAIECEVDIDVRLCVVSIPGGDGETDEYLSRELPKDTIGSCPADSIADEFMVEDSCRWQ